MGDNIWFGRVLDCFVLDQRPFHHFSQHSPDHGTRQQLHRMWHFSKNQICLHLCRHFWWIFFSFGEVTPVSSGEYKHRGEFVHTGAPSEYFWHRRCTSGSQWTWSSTWAAEIRGRHFPPLIFLLFFFMKHCGTTIRHCGSNEKPRALGRKETEGRQRHLSPLPCCQNCLQFEIAQQF